MRKQPIFRKILLPLMGLLILEIGILMGSIYGQGLFQLIHNNSREIIESRVEARRNYLESIMVNQWMNVGQTVQKINQLADGLYEAGKLDIEAIDDSSENAAPFLNAVTDDLITMMRTNHVTGAFLVLNADDLKEGMESGQYQDKPGLYFRDLDPESKASSQNLDLLIERSPFLVVRNKQITTDTTWNTSFQFGKEDFPYYDFLYQPTEACFHFDEKVGWEDLGYWSKPYTLFGEDRQAIAYSVPLRLSDGRVYGVLGVDVLLSYLNRNLPEKELDSSGTASYFMSIDKMGSDVLSDSTYQELIRFESMETTIEDDIDLETDGVERDTYAYSIPLRIFSTNGPFADLEWRLGAEIPYRTMNRFADRMFYVMGVTVILTIFIGLLGSLFISIFLQKPIKALASEVRRNKPNEKLLLKKTGILEIDQMSEALEDLSDRLLKEQENLQYERDHDFLTDLYNRRAFGRRIRELLNHHGSGNATGAYIMMDLDNLKMVNDSFGHEYGDKYIRCASDAMREALGSNALYSRISGDEFNIFIFDEDGNRSKINSLIEKLQKTIDESFIVLPDGTKKMLRLSGGVSWYPDGGVTPDELQKNADYAMYIVKKTTKSHFRVWSQATDLGKEKDEGENQSVEKPDKPDKPVEAKAGNSTKEQDAEENSTKGQAVEETSTKEQAAKENSTKRQAAEENKEKGI